MTSLPHPLLDERMRQNFEAIESIDPKRYFYKEFKSSSSGQIFILPVDSIVLFGTIVFVSDPFDTATRIKVGEVSDSGSIFSALIDEGGKVPEIIVGNLDSNITTKDTRIFLSFSGTLPTKGRGWFLISYLLKARL